MLAMRQMQDKLDVFYWQKDNVVSKLEKYLVLDNVRRSHHAEDTSAKDSELGRS